eukprot:TRINITY_DN1837_c0_g1_i1.p1 TRINITY_DN1837_c0_g1~~TRINITY_DN1837_c0_g1_i1.p1  ORF type:complete len:2069 (+),score=598.65 TRINITY_DN1837_c0_g1_i1:287-6208(+)
MPGVLACITLSGGRYRSSDYESTLTSFEITDHSAAKRRAAAEAAAESWRRQREWIEHGHSVENGTLGAGNGPRPKVGPRITLQWRMDEDGADVLSSEWDLRWIRAVEASVLALPSWLGACWTTALEGGVRNAWADCAAPASAVHYFFPGSTEWKAFGLPAADCSGCAAGGRCSSRCRLSWAFDYLGPIQGPQPAAMRSLFQNPRWRWFTDAQADVSRPRSTLLRTQLTLGAAPSANRSHQAAHRRFVFDLINFLTDCRAQRPGLDPGPPSGSCSARSGPRDLFHWPDGSILAPPPGLTLSFSGDGVGAEYLRRALSHDEGIVAAGTIVTGVFCYLFTRSAVIAAGTLLQLALSFFSAAFFIPLLTDGELSLLTVLALFVALGMSANGAMVFFNTFRHSAFMSSTGRRNTLSVPQRLAWCYRKAGVGTFASHVVALVAFATNAASPVPAVRSFATFLSILTTVNAYLFLTFFPSLVVFHHYHISGGRRTAQRQKEVRLRRSRSHAREVVGVIRDVAGGGFAGLAGPWGAAAGDACLAELLSGGAANARVPGVLQALRREGSPVRPTQPPDEAAEALAAHQEWGDDSPPALAGGGPLAPSRRRPHQWSLLRLPAELTVRRDARRDVHPCTLVEHAADAQGGRDFLRAHAGWTATAEGPSEAGAAEPEFRAAARRWLQCGLKAGIAGSCDSNPYNGKPTVSRRRTAQVTAGVYDAWAPAPDADVSGPVAVIRSPWTRDVMLPAHLAVFMGPAARQDTEGGPGLGQELEGSQISSAPTRGASLDALARHGPSPSPSEVAPALLPHCLRTWWDRRARGPKRRFGRFGKRVGETRDEKDRRLLSKRSKREGFTLVERFLVNSYVPALRVAHLPLLAAWAAALVVLAATTARYMSPADTPPQLLEVSGEAEFEFAASHFPVRGPCDTCSASLRPPTDFPPLDPAALAACGGSLHSAPDRCGVCQPQGLPPALLDPGAELWALPAENASAGRRRRAPDECLDCRREPFGKAFFDICGRCIGPEDTPGSCVRCGLGDTSRLGWCSPCFLAGGSRECSAHPGPGGAPCRYGPRCDVECSERTCPPTRGSCDPLTGECACFADYRRGFFTHRAGDTVRCSRCLPTFYPEPGTAAPNATACVFECEPELHAYDPACRCDAQTRRCNACGSKVPIGRGDVVEAIADIDYEHNPVAARSRGRVSLVDAVSDLYILWDGLGYRWVLSGDVGRLRKVQVQVGLRCSQRHPRACVNGELDELTGACDCAEGWADGGSCEQQPQCSMHGRMGYDPVRGGERCFCSGQWEGEWCESCRCRNGGSCDQLTGECSCTGVWEGHDCSTCPLSCITRGRCPRALPANASESERLDEVHLRCAGCRGFWAGDRCENCTAPHGLRCEPDGSVIGCDGHPVSDPAAAGAVKVVDECGVCGGLGECMGCDGVLGSGKVVDACGVCGGDGGCGVMGGPPATVEILFGLHEGGPTRGGEVECFWEARAEGGDWEPLGVADSVALEGAAQGLDRDGGSFLAPEPPECPAARVFEIAGEPVKCRRFREPLAAACTEVSCDPPVAVVDFDPQRPFAASSMRVLGTPPAPGAEYELRRGACGYDMRFDLSDPDAQVYLHGMCQKLLALEREVVPERSACPLVDFEQWLTSADTKERHAALAAGAPLAFPFRGPRRAAAALLMQFATERGLLGDFGFSAAALGDPELRVLWMRLRMRLAEPLAGSSRRERVQRYRYWERIMRNINNAPWKGWRKPAAAGTGFQWAEGWVLLFTELQAQTGISYSIGVSAAVFLAFVLVFTCSVRLAACACAALAGAVLLTISIMNAAGWALGPPEQVGLAALMGVAAEYLVHITEGYLEYLQSTQSSLLAREGTRLRSLSGTLQRTAAPLLTSALGIVASSAVLLGCEVLVLRRIAHIIIISALSCAFHGVVVFSAFILAIGPTTLTRSRLHALRFAVFTLGIAGAIVAALVGSGAVEGPGGGSPDG